MASQPQDSLAWAVHSLAVAAAEMDAALARRMQLSAGDFLALKHLVIAGAGHGPAELARLLGITTGAATGLVDRLQRAGYVRREQHPGDRRRQTLVTTPLARDAFLRELQPVADDIDAAAAGLTPDQRSLVTGTLLHLAALHRRHAR